MHLSKNVWSIFAAILLPILLGSAMHNKCFAQTPADSAAMTELLIKNYLDSIDRTIGYKTGNVTLTDIATLKLPVGYKYIPADKTKMILHELWGNPEMNDALGMIVLENYTLSNLNGWAFVVSYEEDGYVKDEDADKINYDDLMKEIQKTDAEVNKKRAEGGYPEMHILGWAAQPYYDKGNKVLHWAKKIQFANEEDLVLNYDVRILGRKGVLSLNAVGVVGQLSDINSHIPEIVKMAAFTEGNQYKDFNPSVDKVAAYTIGGLIAGKLIAKTGLLVLLLKNIKLILLAAFGGFAAFRKKILGLFSKSKKTDEGPVSGAPNEIAAMIEEDRQPHQNAEEDTSQNNETKV